MNCPACDHELTSRTAGDVTVDVCDGGCGGIWFDHFELRKLDEQSETAGESLLDIARDPNVHVDPEKRYACPRDTDRVVLMRHFWSVKRAVTRWPPGLRNETVSAARPPRIDRASRSRSLG